MAVQHPDALNEARALVVKGDIDGGQEQLIKLLNNEFYHDEALFMLGACFMARGMNGLAAVVTSAAVDARAGKQGKPFPEALLNLGSAYKAERQNDMAERIWLDALRHETLPKERAKILTNIATLYIHEGQPAEALIWCGRALEEDPNNAAARANRGMAHLELGNWRQGWDGFAATYDSGDRVMRNYGRQVREWAGEPGQRVIVFGDQGIGDEIFFANCMPDMIERCSSVILDCHPRLEGLFKRSFPQVTVYGTRKNLSELEWVADCGAEAKVGLADLPGFFRNSDAEWEGRGKPYLIGPENRVAGRRWPPKRIGVSWVGGTKKTRSELRSVSLDILRPIFDARPDADWFSLQYTDSAAREVCEFEERTGIHIAHFPGQVEAYDYDVTAGFVSSLDLVITVTTAVHDLASALGVPNWVLVPKRIGWRFANVDYRGGTRLRWYDAARLFRQSDDGNWADPVDEIARELQRC